MVEEEEVEVPKKTHANQHGDDLELEEEGEGVGEEVELVSCVTFARSLLVAKEVGVALAGAKGLTFYVLCSSQSAA